MQKSLFFACATLSLAVSGVRAQNVAVSSEPVASFKFDLDKDAKTSAGIYNADGKLVRVLWTLKPMASGEQSGDWDGNDDLGKPLPAGKYSYKVAASSIVYKNIGVIGSTANPPTTFGHVPGNFEGVAVDKNGDIYTVHDWDEPHFDVTRWSGKTGNAIANSGHIVGGLVKAVTVDDAHVYFTFYDDLTLEHPKFGIGRLKIADLTPEGFTGMGKSDGVVRVFDGSPIPLTQDTPEDAGVRRVPLLSLAVSGDTLFCTDARRDLVHLYDKATGKEKSTIPVRLPLSVAIAPDGRIWVAHEHSKVSIFSADGQLLATPLENLKEINALAFGPGGALYIADAGASQVKIYNVTGNEAKFSRAIGHPAQPGDRAPDRFAVLHGVAVDRGGNVITVQHAAIWGTGGHIAKFDAQGKPVWEQLGLEFQSQGNYSLAAPDTYYSNYMHAYHLDRKTGTATYLGDTSARGDFRSNFTGNPRVIRIGTADFFYLPSGTGVQIYRVIPAIDKAHGPTLKLVSLLGHTAPNPTGADTPAPWEDMTANRLWSWHDATGKSNGKVSPEEIIYSPMTKAGAGDFWQYSSMNVDANKNIWFSSYGPPARVFMPPTYDKQGEKTIYMIPPAGLDKASNPIYLWDKLKKWTTPDTSPWDLQIKLVQHSADGSTYAYAGSQKYPNAPQSGGLHMGGNLLMRYDKETLKWMVKLPEVAVGLDAIPTNAAHPNGGVLTGGQPWGGIVHHYSKDGLLIGIFGPDKRYGEKPNNPSGLLDCYGALSINRDPRDGILDVFVEDDYNYRTFWYRFDDRDVQTLSGTLEIAER